MISDMEVTLYYSYRGMALCQELSDADSWFSN